MSAPAAERALALPEILNLILDVANLDHGSLASASLVNSRWYEPATSAFWSEQCAIRPILKVSSERRQNFARKIVHLSLTEDDVILLDRFADPQLISLRTLHVNSWRSSSYCWQPGWFTYRIVPYLHERLESLSLYGPFGQKNLLQSIANRCPRISNLTFDAADNCGLGELLHLLRQLKSLKCVSLTFLHPVGGDEVFKSLAGHTCITRVVLKTVVITASAIAAVASPAELSTPLFPKLDVLRMQIGVDALPILVPIIGSVRDLSLDLISQDIMGTMQQLSTLSNLEALRITFTLGAGITHVLTPVASLPNIQPEGQTPTTCFPKLRRFHLVSEGPYPNTLRDGHLEAIYKHMPLLEDLIVDCKTAMFTSSTLISLGKHCKFLIECQIRTGHFDLEVLDDIDQPLFPCLRLLAIECNKTWVDTPPPCPDGRSSRNRPAECSPSHPRVLATMGRMKFHAPKIRIVVSRGTPGVAFRDAVKYVLREMLEKDGNLRVVCPYSLGLLDEAF